MIKRTIDPDDYMEFIYKRAFDDELAYDTFGKMFCTYFGIDDPIMLAMESEHEQKVRSTKYVVLIPENVRLARNLRRRIDGMKGRNNGHSTCSK